MMEAYTNGNLVSNLLPDVMSSPGLSKHLLSRPVHRSGLSATAIVSLNKPGIPIFV